MKQTKKEKNSKIGLLWHFLDGSKKYYLLGLLASTAANLLDMMDPQIIKATIDNIIGGKPSSFPDWVNDAVGSLGGFGYIKQHLYLVAVVLVVLNLLKVIVQYFQRVYNNNASESLTRHMRNMLFSHIERLPYEWHMSNHTGDIIQRCTSDVEIVRNFLSEQFLAVIRLSIMLVMSLIFMFSMNVKLSLIAVIPLPFLLGFIIYYSNEMHKGFQKCDETEGKVSAIVQENLTGVRVVRAFGKERKERDNFIDKNGYYANLWINMGKMISIFWGSQGLIASIQLILVTVFGCVFCVRGEMTAGDYVAFISYNATLAMPIRRLGRVISEMTKADVSINRIAYIMNSEEEKDNPGSFDAPMDGDIVFDHVDFSYNGQTEVLKDVSFTVEKGTTLGILGGTGSGKSTMMLLLDKMYELPDGCGSITIGGTDIKNIRTEHLRSNIAMVLQEPFMFSRSIKENIGIAVPGITIDEIRAAARAACLDDTVTGFTNGYDTFVGERGVTLSGGQKQRAAIARALTQNAPIMVFDDSLSAVDTETDAKIRKALEERYGSATIIIISHRITTLSKADKVLVLDAGSVSEFGTPDELKASGGIYQQIYEIQSGSREEAENAE